MRSLRHADSRRLAALTQIGDVVVAVNGDNVVGYPVAEIMELYAARLFGL